MSHVYELATQANISNGSWVFILDAEKKWCAHATGEKDWKTKVLTTPTTQKCALIAISPSSQAIAQWLQAIRLKP